MGPGLGSDPVGLDPGVADPWILACLSRVRHAMLMIFFFIMPGVMSGLGNLLVPIQLCVPELVFPKVNNLGIPVMMSLGLWTS